MRRIENTSLIKTWQQKYELWMSFPRILGDWDFILCFLSAKMPWTVARILSTVFLYGSFILMDE